MNWRYKYYAAPWEDLEKRFKWVADMKDVPQDSIHHAEGNVAIHTQMVLDELETNVPEYNTLQSIPRTGSVGDYLADEEARHILWAACLKHDMEKRSTTKTEDNGRITSKGHARKGETSARKEMYIDLVTPFEVREKIAKLVRYHGLPLWATEKENPMRELIKTSQYIDMKMLSIIAKADSQGRTCTDHEELAYRIKLFELLCQECGCWDGPKKFETDLARFHYLNRGGSWDYIPFDDRGPEAIIMMGLPGSGKNTYIKNNFPGMPCVSIDDIRKSRGFDRNDQTEMGHAIQETKEEMKKLMRSSTPFVYNATNLTRDMRSKVLSSIHDWKNPRYKTKIVYLEVPYAEIIRRNNERDWKVPEEAINRMIGRIEIPEYDEAHSIEFVVS